MNNSLQTFKKIIENAEAETKDHMGTLKYFIKQIHTREAVDNLPIYYT